MGSLVLVEEEGAGGVSVKLSLLTSKGLRLWSIVEGAGTFGAENENLKVQIFVTCLGCI